MNKLYCSFALVGGAALLGAPAAQAQAGTTTNLVLNGSAANQNRFRGPGIMFSKGQYQLVRGSWQTGKIFYDGQHLYLPEPQSKDKHPVAIQYPVDSVRSFVTARGDTFSVVRCFIVPKTNKYIRSSFARKMYKIGSIQVDEYTDYLPGLRYSKAYTMLSRLDTTVVLSTDSREILHTIAYMVQDYPALSAQVLQMKEFTPEDLPRVLGIYDRWKAFNARPK